MVRIHGRGDAHERAKNRLGPKPLAMPRTYPASSLIVRRGVLAPAMGWTGDLVYVDMFIREPLTLSVKA
jgi:hypothetical protein